MSNPLACGRASRKREWAVCGGDYGGLALAVLALAVRDVIERAIPDRAARDWLASPAAQNLCYGATGADLLNFLEYLAAEYQQRGQPHHAQRVQVLRRYIIARQLTGEN